MGAVTFLPRLVFWLSAAALVAIAVLPWRLLGGRP